MVKLKEFFKKKKKLVACSIIALTSLLAVPVFANVVRYHAEVMSVIMKYNGHHYITFYKYDENGNLAYCLEPPKDSPNGINMIQDGTLDDRVYTLLKSGYPYHTYSNDNNMDYFITQTALWHLNQDLNVDSCSVVVDTNIQATGNRYTSTGSTYKGKFTPEYFRASVKDLVQKARTQTETQSGKVDVSPKATSGSQNGDYILSGVYTINTPPSVDKGIGNMKLRTDRQIEGLKIYKGGQYYNIDDVTLKTGDTFQVAVPKYTPSGSVQIGLGGTYPAKRAVKYRSPDPKYQNVAIYHPLDVNASIVDKVSFSWEKATIKGTLRVRKVDSATKGLLKGAEFGLYKDGSVISRATVGSNGIAIFSNVSVGDYVIKELKPPTNYQLSNQQIPVNIKDGLADVGLDFEFPNEPLKHTVQVTKVDGATNKPLAGATIGIYKDERLIKSVTTQADGIATFDDLPKDNYKIKEISAPVGFDINTTSIIVEIPDSTSPRTLKYTLRDDYLKHKLKVYKKDAQTGALLQGAKFGLYKGEQLLKQATTDSLGVAEFTDLVEGTYTIKELEAPFNYAITQETKTVTIGRVAMPTLFEETFTNTVLKHNLKVVKKDAVTKKPIQGVGFGLYKGEELKAKETTNSDGEITFSNLEIGTYTLKELNTPVNYKPLGKDIPVEIKAAKTVQTYTSTVENEPLRHTIQVRKNDREEGTFLQGATFELYQGSSKLQTATTNQQGIAEFTNLLKGDYTIKETKAPTGYVLDSSPISVTIADATSSQVVQKLVGNDKVRHSIKITKKASDTGALLDGAEFTLYKTSDNRQVGQAITVKGVATIANIVAGDYYLKETKAPPFYNSTIDKVPVKITVTDSPQVITKEISNDPVKHTITVTKKDADSDDLLKGAKLGLYKGGVLVESKLTGEDGTVTFSNLLKGVYTVKEITPPTNYALTDTVLTFDFNSDKVNTTKTGEILNNKLEHIIKVTKTDSENKQPIKGATFALLKDGKAIDKAVTNDQGIATFSGVIKGDYIIKEIIAPLNYILSKVELPVSIGDATSVQTINKTFTNDPIKHSVQLTKTDSENDTKLQNAVYGIYQGDNLIQQQTTNSSGVLTFTNLRKGSYTVKEITPPVNYELSKEIIPVEIEDSDKSKVIKISAEDNPIKHSIKVIKKDTETKEVLKGASLALLKDGQVIQKGTTTDDGSYTFTNLNKGTYTIREVKPPVNYSLSEEEVEVVIGDNTKPIVVTKDFLNTPIKHTVTLTKTDSETGAKIADAVYGIYKGEAKLQEAKTNKDGVATFTDLRKGDYTIKELKAPINYELSSTVHSVKIEDNTKPIVIKVNATNEPVRHTITVTKKDAETQQVLAGAEFGIYKGEQLIKKETTDAKGVATFTGMRKDNYTIKEITPPVNFTLSSEVITVNIEDSAKPTTIAKEFSNTPIKNIVQITKKDKETDEVLEGAVFGIYKNDSLIKQATTNEDGIATFDGLRKDVYTVKEITPPVNYNHSDEVIIIDIKDSTEVQTIKKDFKNIPIRHQIKVIKKDSESKEVLSGAKFELYQGKKLLQTVESNTQGEAIFTNLLKGDYTVKEIKAPTNYSLSSQILDINISNSTESKVITKDYSNDKLKHNIVITKKDKETGKTLKGAKFGIYKDEKLLQEVTTGEDGTATFTNLIKDNYIIKELTPPINYHLSTDPIPVEIPDTDKALTINKECSNVPIRHTINVTKKDKETSEVLTDAIFAIYQNNKKLQEVTVNDKGVASFTNLLKGDYVIKEVKAPINYGLSNEEIKVSIPDSTSPRTIEKDFFNNKLRHTIEVLKVDAKTKEPLAEAVFELYRGEEKIATATSDEKGIAKFTNLLKDNYKVKELAPPLNYEISREVLEYNIPDCTESKTFRKELTNKSITHTIKVGKFDSETKAPLEGTKFGLYSGDDKLQEATTDATGYALFSNVEKGNYTVKEIEPSINYHNDSTPQSVEILEALVSRTFTLEFKNTPIKHTIKITKEDEETGNKLEGALFGLFKGEEKLQEGKTNADGIVEFNNLIKADYTVKELEPPVNYHTTDKITEFKIPDSTEPKVFEDTFKNTPIRHSVKVTKKDSDTGNVLEGAVFGLFKDDKKIQEGTTNEDGVVEFSNLLKDTYEIKELKAPVGYNLSEEIIKIEMEDATEPQVIEKEFENDPIRFKIKINKIDSETKEPLANVKFRLLNANDNVYYWSTDESNDKPYLIGEKQIKDDTVLVLNNYEEADYNEKGYSSILTTDENGEILLPSAIRFDDFKLVELVNPSGYKKLLEPVEFSVTPETRFEDKTTIKGKFFNVLSTITNDTVGEIVDNELIYPVEVENELGEGIMILTKTDSETGDPLANAKFKIYADDKETVIEKGETDSTGEVKFNLKTGKYYYQEYKSPDGYMLDSTFFEFEIKEDSDITKCEMTNTKMPKTGVVDNNTTFKVLGSVVTLLCVCVLIGYIIIRKEKH